jgi:hypothetical protein
VICSRCLQQTSNKVRAESILFRGEPDQLLPIGILLSEGWDFAAPVICKDEETWRSKENRTSSALLFFTCKGYFRYFGYPPPHVFASRNPPTISCAPLLLNTQIKTLLGSNLGKIVPSAFNLDPKTPVSCYTIDKRLSAYA